MIKADLGQSGRNASSISHYAMAILSVAVAVVVTEIQHVCKLSPSPY
jgi:hypothetical protein